MWKQKDWFYAWPNVHEQLLTVQTGLLLMLVIFLCEHQLISLLFTFLFSTDVNLVSIERKERGNSNHLSCCMTEYSWTVSYCSSRPVANDSEISVWW